MNRIVIHVSKFSGSDFFFCAIKKFPKLPCTYIMFWQLNIYDGTSSKSFSSGQKRHGRHVMTEVSYMATTRSKAGLYREATGETKWQSTDQTNLHGYHEERKKQSGSRGASRWIKQLGLHCDVAHVDKIHGNTYDYFFFYWQLLQHLHIYRQRMEPVLISEVL